MSTKNRLLNFIDGEWRSSSAAEYLDVVNPATGKLLAQTPLSPSEEVNEAVLAAAAAWDAWRRTPATARIQYLFRLKKPARRKL